MDRADEPAEGSSTADRPTPRAVLAVGTLFGLVYLGYMAAVRPDRFALDFEIFRGAAANLRAGRPVYGHSPVGVPNLTYRYPPIVLAWFSLYLLVPPLVGYLLHAATTVAAGVGLGALVIRATERRGVALDRLDRGLIVGFVTVGSYAAPSLLYGNVNHHVALGVAAGLVWLADGEQVRSGVSLALAAVPKVFPALVGVWLLWRRAWRATAAALVTGVGALVAGFVLFGPDLTRRYLTEELLPRSSPDAFVGGLPPESVFVSLRRPLSVAFPQAGSTALAVGALALVAPVVGYLYAAEHRRRPHGDSDRPAVDRLIAVFATLAAILLVLPSYSLYFLVLAYPLVPLLYVLDGRPGILFAGGAALTTLTLKLPDVRTALSLAPLPPGVESTAEAVATAVYTVGTPVLWGSILMLAACVWRARRR